MISIMCGFTPPFRRYSGLCAEVTFCLLSGQSTWWCVGLPLSPSALSQNYVCWRERCNFCMRFKFLSFRKRKEKGFECKQPDLCSSKDCCCIHLLSAWRRTEVRSWLILAMHVCTCECVYIVFSPRWGPHSSAWLTASAFFVPGRSLCVSVELTLPCCMTRELVWKGPVRCVSMMTLS